MGKIFIYFHPHRKHPLHHHPDLQVLLVHLYITHFHELYQKDFHPVWMSLSACLCAGEIVAFLRLIF
jgi:hypothetical protein